MQAKLIVMQVRFQIRNLYDEGYDGCIGGERDVSEFA
jgi:hypothetical protein